MPHDYLRLRFEDDRDGTGKLLARVEASGFSGEGGAYFSTQQIEEFAASLASFPLPELEPFCIAGGFWKSDNPGQLEQEHLALKIYPIDKRGYIGVQVRIASELWPGMRPDSQTMARIEVVTTYEPLFQFSKELAAVVRGSASEAVLVGEGLR